MKNGEILLKGVSKIYKIRHHYSYGSRTKLFVSLNNINLKIKTGDRIGLIGKNGSGKSTLLKIMSGISIPTNGQIISKGKINSLLELTAGFHPDLSGLDNIMLNGLLAGLTRSQVKNVTQKIINYSTISKFIKMPFYTYSSGMKLKLAFSIAIHSNPDILIFDEIVSFGDQKFIKIFKKYFDKVLKQKKTLIYATHLLEVLPLYCTKTIWLEKGKIKMFDKTEKVIKAYQKENNS